MSDHNIRIGIFIGILAIAFSVFYYLVVRPIQNSNQLGKCLERAESIRSVQKQVYRDNCFKQY